MVYLYGNSHKGLSGFFDFIPIVGPVISSIVGDSSAKKAQKAAEAQAEAERLKLEQLKLQQTQASDSGIAGLSTTTILGIGVFALGIVAISR